jgi:Biotin-requiring enzyme
MGEFRMPSLGADREAGTLVEWLKRPGDRVRRGDVVAVVETQKGAIEVVTISVNWQCGSSAWIGRRSIANSANCGSCVSVEQCHARIGPNNATRLSGKEWLCAAARA